MLLTDSLIVFQIVPTIPNLKNYEAKENLSSMF